MNKLLVTALAVMMSTPACALDPGVYAKGKILEYQKKTVFIKSTYPPVTTLIINGHRILARPQSFGSGAIVSKYGHILTAAHVVDNAETVEVRLFGETEFYLAEVLREDAEKDLALLKINCRKRLPYFRYNPIVFIGDAVTVVGHPFLLEWSVTKGYVSGVYEQAMTIDAAVNPGNSGGPVIDKNGKLVGITSAIITPVGAFVGIGVIVAGNQISSFMEIYKGLGRFLK